jgi:hypothetical protein
MTEEASHLNMIPSLPFVEVNSQCYLSTDPLMPRNPRREGDKSGEVRGEDAKLMLSDADESKPGSFRCTP